MKSVNGVHRYTIKVCRLSRFQERLQAIPNQGVWVLSDNPAYKPYMAPADPDERELKIIGRVVLGLSRY